MYRRPTTIVLAVVMTAASCGSDDGSTVLVDETPPVAGGAPAAAVVLDRTGCSSTIPSRSDTGMVGIEIENRTDTQMAVVMGTYADGFERNDLVLYGRDVSTRPDFLEDPEIYEVAPDTARQVTFERGPGRYFAICMDTTSTMIVLDDLLIGERRDFDHLDSSSDDAAIATSPDSTDDLPAGTLASATDVAEPPAAASSADPADQYLDRTREIYRRTINGAAEIVVRQSDVSWTELFDIEWRAPTGSAELCTGDHALFIGEPGTIGWWGSAWEPMELYVGGEDQVTVRDSSYHELSVVRTSSDATEVALLADTGEELDRATFVDGVAVLITTGMWGNQSEPADSSLVLITEGVSGEPMRYGTLFAEQTSQYPNECTPGPGPALPLPPAGEQPIDPGAAEDDIRHRHALLVDRSVTLAEDPPDLLDDNTGVAEAAAEVDAGRFAEAAAAAQYTIGDLVFTTPDEAWFEYTITTSFGVLGGRYGIARFNGSVWQFTRATICQDLAEAGGACRPAFDAVTPPQPDGWDEVRLEFDRTAQLYREHTSCLPPPWSDNSWYPCDVDRSTAEQGA